VSFLRLIGGLCRECLGGAALLGWARCEGERPSSDQRRAVATLRSKWAMRSPDLDVRTNLLLRPRRVATVEQRDKRVNLSHDLTIEFQ
jgi:hypothetical protein